MLERVFGSEARQRIEDAVRVAEVASTGQIVPVVVEKSAGYPEARYRGAFLGAALATLAVLALNAPLSAAELPLVQLAAGVAGALLALIRPIERLLAGRAELEYASRERAMRAFYENGVEDTAEGTGVLVFASLFERRAIVLGDHGIHAKVGDEAWQRAVDALSEGLRQGDPARAFCEAIRLCGEELAKHFPRPAGGGPGNELPDGLRVTKR
jgi:putative membrane protein